MILFCRFSNLRDADDIAGFVYLLVYLSALCLNLGPNKYDRDRRFRTHTCQEVIYKLYCFFRKVTARAASFEKPP